MGMDQTIYIGPYLYCRNSQQDTTEPVITCNNEDCEKRHYRHLMGKHCYECGTILAECSVPTKTSPVSWYDFSTAVDETLSEGLGENIDPNAHSWIPNRYDEWPEDRRHDYDRYTEHRGCRIEPKTIEQELTWFEKTFAKEIETAREMYGAENVNVEWGVLNCLR